MQLQQNLTNFLIAALAVSFQTGAAFAATGNAIVPVSLSNTLPANDDDSTAAVPLNIGGVSGINFFGQNFTSVYVNNNGNLTFGSSLGAYTPDGLATGVGLPIIAPFFADVDTRGQGSGLVMYGNATVNGRTAFVANYINVGYYGGHTDKLNSFQAILVDRTDTGSGNFDIEFNYNQIQWETGDASGGRSGLGGVSAVAGYSNGQTGNANIYFQLPGSLVNGALLDGGPNALATNSLNSGGVPGRYIFQVRNGVVTTGPPPPVAIPLTVTGVDLGTVAQGSFLSASISVSGGSPPYTFSFAGTPPPGLTVSGATVSGIPTQPGNYNVGIPVTDSAGTASGGNISFSVFGFTTTSLAAGITFSPYLASVGVAGGNPPFNFTFSGLPRGLSGTSSGTINGTVTAPVTAQVSVTASDSTGVSVSSTFPLAFTVPPPLSVPSQTLPAGQIGTTYSQSLSATGGAPPYTWSLSSGTLPTGLVFRSTGVISGIPSQSGSFTFGVRATDVTGASAVGPASLAIAPASLTITTGPTSSTGTATAISASLASAVASVEYPTQMISAVGGVPPYTYAVTGGSLPPGVTVSSSGMVSGTPTSPGSYTFTATVTDSTGSATSSATFTVAVRSFSTDLLLSASGLAFALTAASTAAPPAQVIGVQSTTTTSIINYSVSVTPASTNWFTVSPTSGATPGTLNVSLNSQALALATSTTPYQATISVMCLSPAPCAGNAQQVSVSLSVTNPPPMLSVTNNLIAFTTPASAPAAASQSLSVQNTGGGTVGIQSISCAASWCTVGSAPGSLAAGPAVSIPVTADPTGLSPGYYRTTVTIKASTGVATVPVTLFIANGPSMNLAPSGGLYLAVAGGTPNGPDTDFLVDINSAAPVSFTAAVLPGANWLSLQTTSGSASAAQPATVGFTINPGIAAGLAPQTYYATIRVTSPGLVNSPQDFHVILNVAAANAPQRPNPSPTGLLFISSAAAAPPPQSIAITTNAPAAASFQASASTLSGGSWLSVTPTTGSAAPTVPATSQVSVNPAGLSPGIYYGGVNYAFAGSAVRITNVTLIVTAAQAAHANLQETSNAATCTPTQLAPAQNGLIGNYAAPVGWPTIVSVLLLNDCGAPVANGQIAATFSSGDPPLPLVLADLNSGLYAGTWTPRHASAQVTITATASAPGLAPATALIPGSVPPNAAPLLAPNGTLNIYNPLPGAALAPGTLVQISGTALAGASATANAPLPTNLNGTQVIVGGLPATLSSVTPSLLTAELPFELAPAMQYQVVVVANGALTSPTTIQLSGTSPGLAANAAGLLTATHLSGTAVSEAAPAAPGESLVLLAAGLGLTDTPVADGAAGPASPLANALDAPTVSINNETAVITFAGLQPGMVGVYQINVQVPTDAPNGDLTLVLSQDGNPANTTILPVKKPM